MRSISDCLRLKSVYEMTQNERTVFEDWLKKEARYLYDSCDYCYLLGWFYLNDYRIPLSPKEVGLD